MSNLARLSALALSLTLWRGSVSAQESAAVQCGVDVLVRDDFTALRGLRVGLITNHTGRLRNGTTTLDAFLARKDPQLVALFSPEHGFAGKLDDQVGDSRHASGLPIYSLYGDTRKPRPEHLANLDVLVFDIQDIGCRFYTYVSTMGLAMRSAAENGKRFVVLDRPNPIGGDLVEGPVADRGSESFVGWHTLPVRHGMTAGELARMFAAEKSIDCGLSVIGIEGWAARQPFDRCDLEWINPSPNMRSLTQAFLYPAVGLWEFTNLSVGRGTDTPFEVIGAPWLDGPALARRLQREHLPGVSCVPVRFTPSASKFKGEACSGVNLLITDRPAYRAMPLAFALACALRAQHRQAWQLAEAEKLLLHADTLAAIAAGKPWREVMDLHRDQTAAFLARRERYLLYR